MDSVHNLKLAWEGANTALVGWFRDSSTFVNTTTTWSSYYGYVSGYGANDTLSFAGVQFPNTSFGTATYLSSGYYKTIPASGDLGFLPKQPSSSSSSNSGLKSVLHQMLDNASTPIVTLLMNRTLDSSALGSGWLTVGGEDAVNCEPKYAYSPLYTGSGDWNFYMQSACASGTCVTQSDTIVRVDEVGGGFEIEGVGGFKKWIFKKPLQGYPNMYVTPKMMDFFKVSPSR